MLNVGLDANFEGLHPSIGTRAAPVASSSTARRRAPAGHHISTAHAAGASDSNSDKDEGFGNWLT
jgi:hypothetical protein